MVGELDEAAYRGVTVLAGSAQSRVEVTVTVDESQAKRVLQATRVVDCTGKLSKALFGPSFLTKRKVADHCG